jgi:hypothetical protein
VDLRRTCFDGTVGGEAVRGRSGALKDDTPMSSGIIPLIIAMMMSKSMRYINYCNIEKMLASSQYSDEQDIIECEEVGSEVRSKEDRMKAAIKTEGKYSTTGICKGRKERI